MGLYSFDNFKLIQPLYSGLSSYLGNIPSASFSALAYDAATFELTGVQSGTGALTEARTAVINVPDYQGVYRQVATTVPAYHKARHSGGKQYADDGTGTLLDPQPYVVRAPAATNQAWSSNSLTTGSKITRYNCAWIGLQNKNGCFANLMAEAYATLNTALHLLYHLAITVAYGSEQCFSVFLRAGTCRYVTVGVTNGANGYGVCVDTQTWNITEQIAAGPGVTLVGYAIDPIQYANGVRRVIVAGTIPLTTYNPSVGFSNTATPGSITPLFLGSGETIITDGWNFVPGRIASSPIITGEAPVTRDACGLSFDSANISDTAGSLYCEADITGDSNIISTFLTRASGNLTLTDGTTPSAVAMATGAHKIGLVWGDGTMRLNLDGNWQTAVAYDGTLLSGALDLFRSATVTGYMRNLKVWTTKSEAAIDAEMAA